MSCPHCSNNPYRQNAASSGVIEHYKPKHNLLVIVSLAIIILLCGSILISFDYRLLLNWYYSLNDRGKNDFAFYCFFAVFLGFVAYCHLYAYSRRKLEENIETYNEKPIKIFHTMGM